MAKVDMVRIGYKGRPAVNDLISGQVQLMFPTTAQPCCRMFGQTACAHWR
jgi:hypothetical protein